MRIYLAGMAGSEHKMRLGRKHRLPYWLISLQHLGKKPGRSIDEVIDMMPEDASLFLDNGGFKIQKDLVDGNISDFDHVGFTETYIDLLQEYNRHEDIDWYPVIDPPGQLGEQQSKEALEMMEDTGLDPVPVWHINWSPDYLDEICREYDRVAIGGVAPKGSSDDQIRAFREPLLHCRDTGTKAHLLGMTNKKWLWRYRALAFSADSTSWTAGSRWGQSFFTGESHKYFFKSRRPNDVKGLHLNMSNLEQDDFNMRQWKHATTFYDQFGPWGGVQL